MLHSLDDMRNIVVATRNGVPLFLGDVAEVREGNQPPLGRVATVFWKCLLKVT